MEAAAFIYSFQKVRHCLRAASICHAFCNNLGLSSMVITSVIGRLLFKKIRVDVSLYILGMETICALTVLYHERYFSVMVHRMPYGF